MLLRESVGVLLRQETAVSDVLLRHTSDVLLRPVVIVRERERERERRLARNQQHVTVPHYTHVVLCVLSVHNC